jgi:hypothetical protein
MISYDAIKSGEAVVPVAAAPVAKEIGRLPALVEAAAAQLAKAKDAAEVLDAKDRASLIYDAAKRAARLAAAKGAHDTLIAEAHRAQANALKIEAQAKERLADEYDAAQDRGDAAKPGKPVNVPDGNNKAKVDETGLTRKQVHDARRIRNAELAQPGVVDATVEKALAEGKEPTRALVNAAVADALGEERPEQKPRDVVADFRVLWADANQSEREEIRAIVSAVEVGAPVSPEGAAVSASSGRPEGRKRLQVAREPINAAEPDAVEPKREEVRTERGVSPSVTAGETAPNPPSTAPTVEPEATPSPPPASGTHSNPQPVSLTTADKAEAAPPPVASAAPFAVMSKADQIRLIRPYCQHLDDLDKCGGSGRNHCPACKKATAESEAA